jgi:hypothetical protein
MSDCYCDYDQPEFYRAEVAKARKTHKSMTDPKQVKLMGAYAVAKPNTREVPAYFDDDGNLHRGPFYVARLGKQTVGMPNMPGYLPDGGVYMWRSAALEAAKAFQAKCRELVEKAASEASSPGSLEEPPLGGDEGEEA